MFETTFEADQPFGMVGIKVRQTELFLARPRAHFVGKVVLIKNDQTGNRIGVADNFSRITI